MDLWIAIGTTVGTKLLAIQGLAAVLVFGDYPCFIAIVKPNFGDRSVMSELCIESRRIVPFLASEGKAG